MTDLRETYRRANKVVSEAKGRRIGFWEIRLGLAIHGLTRCLSRGDRWGAQYHATKQAEAQEEISGWRRW